MKQYCLRNESLMEQLW